MAETEPDWLLPLRALLGSGTGGDLLMFGAQVAEVDRGRAVVRLPVTPATAGGAQGGVHGGVIATLVDMTLVTATITMLRRGEGRAGALAQPLERQRVAPDLERLARREDAARLRLVHARRDCGDRHQREPDVHEVPAVAATVALEQREQRGGQPRPLAARRPRAPITNSRSVT